MWSLYCTFQVGCQENREYSQLSKTCNRKNSELLLHRYYQRIPHFVATSAPLPVASFTKLTVQGTGFCRTFATGMFQNVMIELYCCGPGQLFWLLLFQIRKGLGSWVFKVLLCKTL